MTKQILFLYFIYKKNQNMEGHNRKVNFQMNKFFFNRINVLGKKNFKNYCRTSSRNMSQNISSQRFTIITSIVINSNV